MPGMRPLEAAGVALAMSSLVASVGCGGSTYSYAQSPNGTTYGDTAAVSTPSEEAYVATGVEAAAAAPARDMAGGAFGGMGGDEGSYRFEDDAEAVARGPGNDVLVMEPRPQLAQNAPQPQGGGAGQGQGQGQGAGQERTDAVDLSGPLLIYMAEIYLAVYEVDAKQDAILAAVTEMGGFLAQRTDDMLVVRVPAARYRDALAAVEATGDVLHRNVQVMDVGEEFRDNAIRIRNAEQMRDRLAQLLARANDVEAALAIERELGRLTDEIERLKGRQRYLADRIAFSTITVRFQALSTEPQQGADGFVLPFPWLNELGLTNLMRLQ